ncbi:MAG: phage tail protein [Desulfobulbaceae bacterium]|nr:phage tail protein [Desulfobulbaceae bacterium]
MPENDIQETIINLARQLGGRRYGKFRATVVDNCDPQKRGRLKLQVPSVLADQESDWALPCLPFGGLTDQGLFTVPEIGAQVWMEFEEGDISRPIWTGTFWQQEADVPVEAAKDEPTTRLLKTPSGHVLQFDDESGKEVFRLHHPSEAELTIDENGVIKLVDASASTLTLDAQAGKAVLEDSNGNTLTMSSAGTVLEDSNGNKIEMTASGITVKGQQVVIEGSMVALGGQGGEPVIKGSTFLSLFATHIHTAPPLGGPTTPPIPQGEASSLSTKVMTS